MAQTKFVNQYTRLDRALHRLAFSTGGLQVSLADLEDRLYGKQLAEISIDRPVFVTALPRAGTTMLLNLLAETGEFATHTYKSMPFVLCPLFWHRFSKGAQSRSTESMERAHGDGIEVSIDSPEAFEEVIWRYFWPSQYGEDHIRQWSRKRHPEFVRFFQNHMRKQIFLSNRSLPGRYLSKNNMNIARLAYLQSVFPDSNQIVVFRQPLQHASSLLKQHLNFLARHAEDDFARAYMRAIGHFDFGENFLPVNFDGWLAGDRRAESKTLSFWLEYWVAAYRNILANLDRSVHLTSFETLTGKPTKSLEYLAGSLELRDPERLIRQDTKLREAAPHPVDTASVPSDLLREATSLYEELVLRAAEGSQMSGA